MTTDQEIMTMADAAKVAHETGAAVAQLADMAQSLTVTSNEEYGAAGALLAAIKGRAKDLDEQRRSLTRPLDDAKARIIALFRPPTDALTAAEATVKAAMLGYDRELEAKRRAQEDELRRKAEAERKRLEARARAAEQADDDEKAEAFRRQADDVSTPTVIVEQPQAQGVSTRTVWRAEVTDFRALVKAVAAGEVRLDVLRPDMTELNKVATGLHDQMRIPGVRAVSEQQMAARAR